MCVCQRGQACVGGCTYVCMWRSEVTVILFHSLSYEFFRQGLLLIQKHINLARLAVLWAPGTLLSSQHWDYRTTPPHLAVCFILIRSVVLASFPPWQQSITWKQQFPPFRSLQSHFFPWLLYSYLLLQTQLLVRTLIRFGVIKYWSKKSQP